MFKYLLEKVFSKKSAVKTNINEKGTKEYASKEEVKAVAKRSVEEIGLVLRQLSNE